MINACPNLYLAFILLPGKNTVAKLYQIVCGLVVLCSSPKSLGCL